MTCAPHHHRDRKKGFSKQQQQFRQVKIYFKIDIERGEGERERERERFSYVCAVGQFVSSSILSGSSKSVTVRPYTNKHTQTQIHNTIMVFKSIY